MTEINWAEVPEKVYEEMVSVLLSRLHDPAERIDGAGGRERTEHEYDQLFAAAGLERTATIPTPGLRAVIEVQPAGE